MLALTALLHRPERNEYSGYVEMWGPDGEHVIKPITRAQFDSVMRAIRAGFR
jgi:hypothetical protein